jgi:hypothetical protein
LHGDDIGRRQFVSAKRTLNNEKAVKKRSQSPFVDVRRDAYSFLLLLFGCAPSVFERALWLLR